MRCPSNSPPRRRFSTSSGRLRGSTSSTRSTAPRRVGGCTVTSRSWIEIAAEWGTRDYWEQWRAVRVPDAAHRGGQLGHSAGPNAADARNRLADDAICESPRRALVHDEATAGRTASAVTAFLSTLAQRARHRPRGLAVRSGCGSRRVRAPSVRASELVAETTGRAIGADTRNWSSRQPEPVRAVRRPAQHRRDDEGGHQDRARSMQ